MAARVTGRAAASPVRERARAGYDNDFYTWSLEQARLVRDGEWAAVDRENVAEEIEALGREQFNKLESAFRVLLVHMLKWDHQPGKRSRSWSLSIKEQRLQLEDVIADNPGLKSRIGEAIARAYRKAQIAAAKESGLEESAFPQSCPYSYEDIVSRAFSL
jgi:Domain of unknown function DUF29